jgi:hypothetical protein
MPAESPGTITSAVQVPPKTVATDSASLFAGTVTGSGLHLAHTVRAMKVYGVTDETLSSLESTHWSAAAHYGVVTFALGVLVNIGTNAIFQDKISQVAWGIMIGVVPLCVIGAIAAYRVATRYEQSRKDLITHIRSSSIYVDPRNDEIMRLLDQIKTITSEQK